MCAQFKLTESCDISFYSQSTLKVAQRALRESNQYSNGGDTENDALTNALGTKEEWSRVHGVSSKLTWKEGFPQQKSSYWKRKMASSPTVDMEDLKI
jgi:hypothetical protein